MRFCAVCSATERIIHEALCDQPERTDELGFLSLAEIHAIEMMEVFFNVECHQPRASPPLISIIAHDHSFLLTYSAADKVYLPKQFSVNLY